MFLALLMLLLSTNAEAKQVKVAVVDTGLDLHDARFKGRLCKEGHQDFTGEGIQDEDDHGTHIAGIIVDNAGNSDYCLVILKFYSKKTNGHSNFDRSSEAFKRAIELGVDLVNFSGGGVGQYDAERSVIESAVNTRFVVAAGNLGKRLNDEIFYYPASYGLPNMDIVGNMTENGERNKSSNYGPAVKYWEIGTAIYSTLPGGKYGLMTGTSQAAAVRTGKLIKKLNRRH